MSCEGRISEFLSYKDEYDVIRGSGGQEQLAVEDLTSIANVNFSLVHSNGGSLNFCAINLTEEEDARESQTTTDGG